MSARILFSVIGCLIATVLSGAETTLGDKPKAMVERFDADLWNRHANFGYSENEVARLFRAPRILEIDTAGMATERLKSPPAVGLHPRVLFNDNDLPDLRHRLDSTVPGRLQMAAIRESLAGLITGPKAKYAELYARAVQGEASPDLTQVEPACAIIYESFRCLIDQDDAGGRLAAAALASLAVADAKTLDAAFLKPVKGASAIIAPAPLRDYQETMGLTQCGLLGLGYDFAFRWMNEAQRQTVRAVVAKASANMTFIGLEAPPAFPANTSNWISMHERLIFLACAIEGEDGSDPDTYRRCVEGYKRYLDIALFSSGEMYEGMGKGFLLAEHLVPIANRGVNLLALKKIRAQVGGYFLHALDPWGAAFTFYDSLGGRGNSTPMHDLIVLKHFFPSDPAIDLVYRSTVGQNYEVYKTPVRFGHPFHLCDGLIRAIFAEEFTPGMSWEQARDRATAGKPLTYFSDETSNVITRSDWTSNALQLHVLTRSISGGHQYADRGHVGLHALGRYWSIYKPMRQVEEHYRADHRSVLLIDGNGAGMSPGRCIAFADQPEATFTTMDLTTTWAWTTGGNNRFPKGGQTVPFSANFFRLHKSPLSWMDMSWSDLPNWQTGMKGAELWLPHHPVQRAFRSAGLVRGAHPYALIADDIQQDDQEHEFRWLMQLEEDLVVRSTSGNDLILGERTPPTTGERRLLVRLLAANGTMGDQPIVFEPYQVNNPPNPPISMLRLAITARTKAPGFTVLVYPHRAGDALPTTSNSVDRHQFDVHWADQQDAVAIGTDITGHPTLAVSRSGRRLVSTP